MTRRAAPLIVALMTAGSALAAWPAAAEITPGQQDGLGITARDVPELLRKAKADPYAPVDCEAAYQEVAQLDQILGPDANEPETSKSQAGNLLMKGARSLIPYREVFRVLTGVDRKERELAEAAMAGWARRGYLKGQLRDQCSGSQTIAAADSGGVPASAATPDTINEAPLPPPSNPVQPQDLEEPVVSESTDTLAAVEDSVNQPR